MEINPEIKSPFENTLQEEKTYGKYFVFYKKKNSEYLFAIGPHWWASIIGMLFLTLLFSLIAIALKPHLISPFQYILYLIYIFMMIFYILTFLKNPGIFGKNKNNVLDFEEKKQFDCDLCKTPHNSRYGHCEDCDICIEGLDHHCVWTGKCIGSGNLYIFYAFCATIPVFFFYVMLVATIFVR